MFLISPMAVYAGLAAIYCLPTLLAVARHHDRAWLVAAVNIGLGWTIIGYIAALVWATRPPAVCQEFRPDAYYDPRAGLGLSERR